MTKWSLKTALWIWILSPLCTGSFFLFGWNKWQQVKRSRLHDSAYCLSAIIQTGPEKEALKSEYFAEVLGLSHDRPVSIYAIDPASAEKLLKTSPLLSEVSVARKSPNALYIDYTVRRPMARLADYANTLVDEEGHLFPMVPFFPPKELTELYLGLPPFGKEVSWQVPLSTASFSLAKEVFHFLGTETWREEETPSGKVLTWWNVKRVDVSNAFAKSLGQREIVLLTEEHIVVFTEAKEIRAVFPKILRLSPKSYREQLPHFFTLQKSMLADYAKQVRESGVGGSFAPRIVDLRLSQLAFVQND